jgi:NADPH-dependent 2,4-dienoyl-CoA reductase/sulfur reductase-like enzyme
MTDEALRAHKKVTLVEAMDQLLGTSMDAEFGKKAREIVEAEGAEIILSRKVNSILGNAKVTGVKLEDGREIEADMVILSTGCQPNVKLAEDFELDCDARNGIMVNEYQRTSDTDIFAIGDCAAKYDFFTGEHTDVRLASTAMAEGRLVGSDLFAVKVIRKYISVLGSFSTKIGTVFHAIRIRCWAPRYTAVIRSENW